MTDQHASTPLAALRGVVLDTETTGLDARRARVIQIGALRVEGTHVLAEQAFERLVNPGIPIPTATTAVHGLSDAAVASAPAFRDIADDLVAFLGGLVIIGHTIGYDLIILQREFEISDRRWSVARSLDVRLLAEVALPSLAQYDLDSIAAALGVVIKDRHTAMGDARAAALIFAALLPLLRRNGIRTLGEADTAVRNLSERQASLGRRAMFLPVAADRRVPLQRIDSFPYRHRVADLMSSPAQWCDPSASIRSALKLLLESKISSVLVRRADGVAGIVTERDLLRAVDRHGEQFVHKSVVDFMSHPLQTVREDDFVYRAIGRLGRLGIRHLAVTNSAGDITGVVTTRNLLQYSASAAIVLGDDIDMAASETALAQAWAQLPMMTRSLVNEDIDPSTLTAVISSEVCALTRRAAELAEQAMVADGKGPPPVDYAVLVLGSAGRGECLLAADQDNAFVFATGAPDGVEDRWFADMAAQMNRILDVIGVPLCRGGVMANNSAWRGSIATWRDRIGGWINHQRPEDLLNVDIFFDGTVVHGDQHLGDAVLDHAYVNARNARDFQMQLALMASRWQSPVGIFGGIKADATGRIDLKKHGLFPIMTAARVFAIQQGTRVRGTPSRWHSAVDAGLAAARDIEELIGAHRCFLRLMIDQQLVDGENGIALSTKVAVKHLDPSQKNELKQALRKVATAIDLVSEGRQ